MLSSAASATNSKVAFGIASSHIHGAPDIPKSAQAKKRTIEEGEKISPKHARYDAF